jgi:hypothetical protein
LPCGKVRILRKSDCGTKLPELRSLTGVQVKPQLALLLAVFSVSTALQAQKREGSQPSLEQTISWMEHFSRAHGFLYTRNQLVRNNFVTGLKRCTILIEVHFAQSTKSSEVKNQETNILLSDFSPTNVQEVTNKDEGTYRVSFERSDADHKIEGSMEMGDGTKTKVAFAEEWLFFDSDESAKRFSHALRYAITSCGGKSSAF